ncbi:MAG: hypothetical protein K1X85_14180 [Ignavibacteria bacterium]|nr:hypothetical protein [Ignavibacteria bacterium]
MREEILAGLSEPALLERSYRKNKTAFRKEFNLLYDEISVDPVAQVWNERLNYSDDAGRLANRNELLFVIIAALLAGIGAKLPEIGGISSEYFYPRFVSFIVFPVLTAYFAVRNNTPYAKLIPVAVLIFASAVYMAVLPDNPESDTLRLACIHIPFILWACAGYVFSGCRLKDNSGRIDYLKFNGDMAVMTAVILIAGVILTVLSIGLFSQIDRHFTRYFTNYVAMIGLAAAPVVSAYLIDANPAIVNKVSPVIARVFTPLVLITLIVYLVTVAVSGKDPFNDREFLLIFNLLLIGVMAIILFSVAESSAGPAGKAKAAALFALSVLTIVVNCIALSAIVFRISEWGFTPNRLAVLGGNVLILTNLIIVSVSLRRSVKEGSEIGKAAESISAFLPVYILWAAAVAFLFPVVFGFR